MPTHPLRTHRLAIAAAFATQGLCFISLTTRLPVVEQRFGLGALTISGLMLMMVLLGGLGSLAAETAAARLSSAHTLRVGLVTIAAAMALIGIALSSVGSLPLFVAAMATYGLGLGMVDATTNMQAVTLEHALGRPVLPSFHGAWTVGGIVATVIALTLGTGGADGTGVAVAAFAGVALLCVAAPLLPRDTAPPTTDTTTLGVPWRPILLIGLAMVLFYTVDTATTAWGPLYVANPRVFDDPAPGGSLVALASLPYLVATLLARLIGDHATARFGAPAVVRAGALVAAAGLAIVVTAPTWVVAVAGFTVVGLGIAVVAPLSFSAAAALAGDVDPALRQRRVDAVVARFNQFNYVGALLGAVLTGAIGSESLRLGYAVPMVLVLAIVPLARHFAPRGDAVSPAAAARPRRP